MKPQSLNEDCYAITTLSEVSQEISLKEGGYGHNAVAIIVNDSDKAVFVKSTKTTGTATFPTSASTPVRGRVIGAKSSGSFELPADDRFIQTIQASSGGAGGLSVTIGQGI